MKKQNVLAFVKRWRDDGYKHIYGTDVLQSWCSDFTAGKTEPLRLLDIGCGDGRDLLAIRDALKHDHVELYGIECTEKLAAQARAHGVHTYALDLETNRLPFDDNYFDIVVANQVLEHLKNWIWALQEQVRVTKVSGTAIVGVPNLAALHNRALVLLGRQPSCIKADGPHVRGFTLHELNRLGTSMSGVEPVRSGGTYMYGFPPQLGKLLGSVFPALSATILVAFEKRSATADVLSVLNEEARFETNYFTGRM